MIRISSICLFLSRDFMYDILNHNDVYLRCNMSIDVQGYIGTTIAPWGKLFYRLVWNHLHCERKRILDFGSGLGITANYLAKKNEVIAIEPNSEMIANRVSENPYVQLVGSMDELKKIPDESLDVIICHNVLEYVEDRKCVLQEFTRILKRDGFVSILKHNKAGKIMQKVVFENNTDDAIKLLSNMDIDSVNFGTIREYEVKDLEEDSNFRLRIDHVYGLRTFYALQRNDWKYEEEWIENMFRMECAVEELSEFREIAFFHHVILKPR